MLIGENEYSDKQLTDYITALTGENGNFDWKRFATDAAEQKATAGQLSNLANLVFKTDKTAKDMLEYIPPNTGPGYYFDDKQTFTAKDTYDKVGLEDLQLAKLLDVSNSDLQTWKGATQVNTPTIKPGSIFTSPSANAENALPSNTFIENRLPALLDSKNPYIETARARALQAMNARGLTNSTMGQQAGETAAIEAALQIAGPDAATTATAYRDVLGKDLQTELNAQQGTINSQLQSEQIQGNADVTAMQESQQNVRTAFDGMVRQYIADQQLAGEEIKALSATSSEVMQQFMNKYTEIQLNEEMSPEDKQLAINDLWSVSQSSLGLAASLQGVEFDFSGVSTNITSSATPDSSTSGSVTTDESKYQTFRTTNPASSLTIDQWLSAGKPISDPSSYGV